MSHSTSILLFLYVCYCKADKNIFFGDIVSTKVIIVMTKAMKSIEFVIMSRREEVESDK